MDMKQQYERVFKHIDDNGDGLISPSQLRQCICMIGGELSETEAEEVVLLMDSDHDGLLGLEDFERLMEGAKEEEEKVKELREAFRMYVMGDGGECITPKSLKRMLSKLGESKTVDECKLMISHYDLNGDGVLNFEEFKIMMS